MNSNINWMGNRVFDPGPARQAARPVAAPIQQDGPSAATASALQESTPAVWLPPTVPRTAGADPSLDTQQGPPPSTEKGYIPYYLANNIGRSVRAEFIIGSNQYADKTGVLSEVGINYFVLHDVNSNTDIMCDLYSVKFVTVLLS